MSLQLPHQRHSLALAIGAARFGDTRKLLQCTLLALAASGMSAPLLAKAIDGATKNVNVTTWDVRPQSLIVGKNATGLLNISAGGVVKNTAGIIGRNTGSDGSVSVSGDGTKWTNSKALTVGRSGTGSLDILDGGKVTNTAGIIGQNAGSDGSVSVDGNGSSWANSKALTVGLTGKGSLDILHGGKVANTAGTIGRNAGSDGSVSVNGDGSTWTNSKAITVGRSGTGRLNILDGGKVTNSAGTIGLNAVSNGSVSVSGAGSTWTNNGSLIIGRTGTGILSVAEGAVAAASDVTLATRARSSGILNIGAAAGDAAVAAGTLDTPTLAFGAGTGSLVFNHTDTDYSFAPLISGSAGNINVHSGNTTLTAANTFGGNTTIYGGTLGVTGQLGGNVQVNNGALAITGGGVVNSTGDSSRNSWVGLLAGDIGDVSVSGPNSTWTNADAWLWVGRSGTGSLSILDGGTVSDDFGVIGALSDSRGTVSVSGVGSQWLNREHVYVGSIGKGSLSVLNGGRVESTLGVIGSSVSGSGATGTASVSGAGSQWLSDSFWVGGTADGSLTIAEGALVSATSDVKLAYLSGSSGTLNIGAGAGDAALAAGTLTSPSLAFGDGTGTLVFNHTDTAYTFAPLISGSAGNINVLSGMTTLTAANTYTGNTTIDGGTLAVNGSLPGAVQVNSGGRLQGSGSVGSVTLASGGVFAPGNSIGTQTVNGNLVFNGGSIYEVEVDPASANSDLIQVNGVATLAGQVQHVGEGGSYQPLSTYTILSASGGFAGTTFAGVTSDFAFLTPSLSYDLNNVYLGLLRNDTAVVDLAQTSNQFATASALDSLPVGGALSNAILALQASEVPGVLDSLSGELYASATGAVLQNSQEFSHSLLQRSGSQLDESKRTALPMWIEGEGATRRNDGDSNTAEAIQRGGSVAIGGELAMPNDWILGGAFRYGDHRLSVDERNSHADIDSYSFGLYGRWAEPLDGGSLRMTVGGIYGVHSIDADRDIYTPGMRQALSSDYDATSRQVFGEVGYAMVMDSGLQLEPYAGLSWTQAATDSFTEKGGDAALHGNSQNNDMTASTLGLRSQLPLGNAFKLDAGLGWQHNYSDVNPEADLNFAGSSTYTVEGASLGRDTALIDLGASYRIAPAVTVRAGYSGQYGDNVSSNGGNLTLSWEL